MEQSLAVNESIEIHELLNFKTICIVQSKMLQGIVFDEDLKALMKEDVNQSSAAAAELQQLLSKGRTTLN